MGDTKMSQLNYYVEASSETGLRRNVIWGSSVMKEINEH